MNEAAAPGSPADRARPHRAVNPAAGAARTDADAATTQRVTPPAPHHRLGAPDRAVRPSRVRQPAPVAQQTPWWIQRPVPPAPHASPANSGPTQPPYWGAAQRPERANPGARQFTGPLVGIELHKLWPGKHAFSLNSPRPVPQEIQKSFLLWLVAAVLTAALMIVSVIGQLGSTGGSLGGPFFLLLFGAALLYGAAMMREGHRWARILNLVLAFIASWVLLAFLLVVGGIFTVLSAAASAGYDLPGSTTLALLISTVSGLAMIAALAAIITATVYMFKRPANEYLSASSRA